MATRIMLENVRLSYPTLWTPKEFEAGDGVFAWTAQFLLDPENPKHAAKIKEVEAIERKEFRAAMGAKGADDAKFEAAWKALSWDDRALRDGIHKAENDGYEGKFFMAARATQGKQSAPVILDRRAARVAEGAEGAPYAGCFVNAQVEVWAQFGKYKGTRCTLLGVQFVRDGDAFGGGRPADLSAFADLGDQGGDDGDDLSGLT